jgi:hypothetical protein
MKNTINENTIIENTIMKNTIMKSKVVNLRKNRIHSIYICTTRRKVIEKIESTEIQEVYNRFMPLCYNPFSSRLVLSFRLRECKGWMTARRESMSGMSSSVHRSLSQSKGQSLKRKDRSVEHEKTIHF